MQTQNYNELHDVEAESAVISSLIYHPNFVSHSDFLLPKMFYQEEMGCLYWAINSLYRSHITNIDEINLNNQLNSNAAVKRTMQQKGLGDIRDFIGMSKNAARDTLEEYIKVCETVATFAYRREMYKFGVEVQRGCFNEKIGISDFDSTIHQRFSSITQNFLLQEEIKSAGEIAEENLKKIKERQGTDVMEGIPSKFQIFHPYFAYMNTRLVVFEGRQKSAKSMILLNEGLYAAMNGVPTLYIDSEINDHDFTNRLLANISGVKYERIDRANDLSEKELNNLAYATEKLKNTPLYHFYFTRIDPDKVYSLCEKLKYEKNIQFVIYDYIKGMAKDMGELSNMLGNISQVLKNEVGGKLNYPVLAACQLNRGDQVFGSDQIEMNINTSIKIARKEPEEIREDGGLEYGVLKAKVTLNRDGGSTSDWMSLGADLDRCRIFDCKQPVKPNPFGEETE